MASLGTTDSGLQLLNQRSFAPTEGSDSFFPPKRCNDCGDCSDCLGDLAFNDMLESTV